MPMANAPVSPTSAAAPTIDRRRTMDPSVRVAMVSLLRLWVVRGHQQHGWAHGAVQRFLESIQKIAFMAGPGSRRAAATSSSPAGPAAAGPWTGSAEPAPRRGVDG